MSSESKCATIQLLCSLHTGAYKGLNHALEHGEIEDLFTYAQYLAGQEKNAAKFSDVTLSTYIATALQKCSNGSIVNAN